MNRCPYCQALCRPHLLLWVTRWTPYECPKCQKLSGFRWWQNAIGGGIGGGSVKPIADFLEDYLQQPLIVVGGTVFLVFLLVMVVLLFVLQLRPEISEEVESVIQGK